jgi:hypothetical protein
MKPIEGAIGSGIKPTLVPAHSTESDRDQYLIDLRGLLLALFFGNSPRIAAGLSEVDLPFMSFVIFESAIAGVGF